MRIRAPVGDARHQDILELEPLLRRVVGARVRDPGTVDDLVQEALARVLAARERLDDEAVTPYAIVTARNLVISLAREQERGRRHRPRLVDLSEPERPEDAALRQQKAAAVEAALAGLPDHEREAVVAHEVEGVDTATLAEARRSTPGAVEVQLARTPARLRLDYLLALRRVELPTARRRPGPTTTTLPAPAAASGGGGSGVRLVGKGESPLRVRAGQRASFTGRLVPNPPEHAQRVGMVPSEGAALGQRQGHHIEVAYADITLEP